MSGLFGRRIAFGIFVAIPILLTGCEKPVQFSHPIGEPIPLKGTRFEGANLWNFDYFGPFGSGNPSLYTKQIGPDEFTLTTIHFDFGNDGKDIVQRGVAKINKIKDYAYDDGIHVMVLEIFRDWRIIRGGNWNSAAKDCETRHSNFRSEICTWDNQGLRLARNLFGTGETKSLEGRENRPSGPEIRMVPVEGGRLPEGSKFAGVEVAGYEIGAFEVSWKQWRVVHEWALKNGYKDLPDLEQMAERQKGESHPVRSVSWVDAVLWSNALSEMEGLNPVYFNETNDEVYNEYDPSILPSRNPEANGYRLPTEAEWEWAARGGTKAGGHAYSGGSDLNEVAWYAENSGGEESGPQPVGGKKANELGIFDMSGNVDEWCEDLQKQYMYFLMTSPYGREVAFFQMNEMEILKDDIAGRIPIERFHLNYSETKLVTANKTETEKYIRENRPRLFSLIEPIVAKWVGGSSEDKPQADTVPSPDINLETSQSTP